MCPNFSVGMTNKVWCSPGTSWLEASGPVVIKPEDEMYMRTCQTNGKPRAIVISTIPFRFPLSVHEVGSACLDYPCITNVLKC